MVKNTKKKHDRMFRLTMIIFMVIGFCFIGGSFVATLKYFQIKNDATEVLAKITNETIKTDDDNSSSKFYVTYSIEGKNYQNIPLNYSSSNMKIGKYLKIYIFANNPTKIYGGEYILAIVLFFFGFIFTSISILYLKITTDYPIRVDLSSINIDLKQANRLYDKIFPETNIKSVFLYSHNNKYFLDFKGYDTDHSYNLTFHVPDLKIKKKKKVSLNKDPFPDKVIDTKINFTNIKPLSEIIKKIYSDFDHAIIQDAFLEKNMDNTYWEIYVESNHDILEVHVNAFNGDILSTKEVD